MRFILFILIFVCCSFIPQGFASENTKIVVADFPSARLKQTGTAKIAVVVDAKTILMDDGTIIHLLGATYPKKLGDDGDNIQMKTKSFLETRLPKGTDVKIWQTAKVDSRENRMGHNLAHLEVKKTGEWMNGAIIADGLAWVMTDKSNAELASELYRLEEAARAENKGLWEDESPYQILAADKAAKGNGLFSIVDGVVTKASGSKNNIFLNFGNDSKKDFTVMISPVLRKILARQGIDVLGLSGQKIRVRGWVRDWNGAFMELETAERLEVLSTSQPTALSTEQSKDSGHLEKTRQSNP